MNVVFRGKLHLFLYAFINNIYLVDLTHKVKDCYLTTASCDFCCMNSQCCLYCSMLEAVEKHWLASTENINTTVEYNSF